MDNQWLKKKTPFIENNVFIPVMNGLHNTDIFIFSKFLYSSILSQVLVSHFSCLLDERKKQFILQAFHCIEIRVFISIISMNFYQNLHACLKLSLNFGKKIDEFIFSILITSNACNIKVIFLCWDETVKQVIGVMYVWNCHRACLFLVFGGFLLSQFRNIKKVNANM